MFNHEKKISSILDYNSVFAKGEYEVSIKGFMPCTQPPVQNDFQFNFHLHKISANASEIRGTITHAEPLDDSYDVKVL